MEINDLVVKGKITLVIKDYKSVCTLSGSLDIKDLVNNKLKKTNVILINDISDLVFYELRVIDVINKFAFMYNIKGTKFIKQILKLSTLTVDYLEKDPMLLNNSEKFKLILALVLILNPTGIIINNMSCYLDSKSKSEVMFTLKKLRREYNKTIVIIDNDVDYFYSVCDNVIVLNNDKVILSGKKEILFDNYMMLKRKKISIPIYIEFVYYVKQNRNCDMLVRDDVKDIMKDIYRSL